MLRHPFYLALCLFSVGYLALADVRGWSFLQSMNRTFFAPRSGLGRGGSYGTFNHK